MSLIASVYITPHTLQLKPSTFVSFALSTTTLKSFYTSFHPCDPGMYKPYLLHKGQTFFPTQVILNNKKVMLKNIHIFPIHAVAQVKVN